MLISLIGLDEAVADTAETTTSGLAGMDSFMSIIMIAIGIFAVYSALTGKGPAYKNDYPASMQKEANALLRKFLWIIGPIATITGVLDFIYKDTNWPYLVSLALILPLIIIYIVMFRKKFKDDLKRMR